MDLHALLEELACGDESRFKPASLELAALGQPALPVLGELLASPQAERRWWGVRALVGIPTPQASSMLVQALKDEDEGVRWCAALGLRQRPDPQAIPALLELMQSGGALSRRLAGDALAAGGQEAVPELLQILQDGPQPARLEAMRALAMIGDARAIPALFAVLDEASAVMEYWARQGLERMGVGMVFFQPSG